MRNSQGCVCTSFLTFGAIDYPEIKANFVHVPGETRDDFCKATEQTQVSVTPQEW